MSNAQWTFTPDVNAGGGPRVAVLDVEAPTVLTALEATRATWERFPLRVLDAPKGGGETHAGARVVGERAVCVKDRRPWPRCDDITSLLSAGRRHETVEEVARRRNEVPSPRAVGHPDVPAVEVGRVVVVLDGLGPRVDRDPGPTY